jgi:hypothetical protein
VSTFEPSNIVLLDICPSRLCNRSTSIFFLVMTVALAAKDISMSAALSESVQDSLLVRTTISLGNKAGRE